MPTDSVSCRALSTTTPRSRGWPRRWTSSTPSAVPAAITRSTCRIPPKSFPDGLRAAGQGRVGRARTDSWSRVVIEKPFGHDLDSATRAEQGCQQRLPRGLGLPHRPLPRQGDGAEHPGAAVRQPAVRPDLERALRRPRADHHGRGHRPRRPRRLLRRDRRRPRRDPEPPDAAAGADRDGGAGSFDPRSCRPRRSRCSPRPARGTVGRDHVPRPVHRGLAGRREGGRAARGGGLFRDSTTETFAAITARGRHQALGRGAVLPAHRKAAGPQGHRDRPGLQAGSAPARSTPP